MRLISDDVLEMVAGGTQTVTIVGDLPPDVGWDWGGGWGGGGGGDWDGGGGNGGGGGGGGGPIDGGSGDTSPVDPSDHTFTSPPPERTPAIVALNDVRNAIQDMADKILQQNANWEWGGVLIRGADGQLKATEIATIRSPDSISYNLNLNAGDKIVAVIHSHPDLNDGIDQRFPSTPATTLNSPFNDTSSMARLLDGGFADPGGLMYILDMKSRDVYEYTMGGDLNNRQLGANITDNRVPFWF